MRSSEMRVGFVMLFALIFLFCGMDIMANPNGIIKKREITRSFNLNDISQLEVDNRYGNITVSYWNKGELSIKVVIECMASNDKSAQNRIDNVDIDITNQYGTVSACTNLKGGWGDNDNHSLMIDYIIQMPAGLKSDLSQKYGNINLPDRDNGEMDLEVKYGNINAGDFNSPLSVDAKYSNVNLGNLIDAQLDVAYVGNIKIKNAHSLVVDSKYSNMHINNVDKIEVDCRYGNVDINNVKDVKMDFSYSGLNVNVLQESLEADMLSFGNMNIKHLSPSFKRFRVDSSHGNVKIKMPASASFKVVAENMKYSKCEIEGYKMSMNRSSDSDDGYRYDVNNGKGSTIYFNGNNFGNINIKAE